MNQFSSITSIEQSGSNTELVGKKTSMQKNINEKKLTAKMQFCNKNKLQRPDAKRAISFSKNKNFQKMIKIT